MPQDCPQCESESPRVILTAPAFFCMPSDKRKAHATNEQSRHAPKTLDQYKAAHGPGCGCCSTAKKKPARLMTKTKSGIYTTTLTAKLVANGAPLSGRTVVFSTGGTQLCSVTTDSSGTASCGVSVKTNAVYRSLQKNVCLSESGGTSLDFLRLGFMTTFLKLAVTLCWRPV